MSATRMMRKIGDVTEWKLASGSKEAFEYSTMGYISNPKSTILPSPTPFPKTITADQVKRNFATYRKMRPEIKPRITSSSDKFPKMQKSKLKFKLPSKKFKYLGVGKPIKMGKSPMLMRMKKGGLLGSIARGTVSMLNTAILKGALDPMKGLKAERYMLNMGQSKNMLNTTRLGLASGTNKLNNSGSTVGLVNAMRKH